MNHPLSRGYDTDTAGLVVNNVRDYAWNLTAHLTLDEGESYGSRSTTLVVQLPNEVGLPPASKEIYLLAR